MRGYTIQNSINLLEKGGGAGGASSAANVSFDNIGTGLIATNAQAAISELDARDNYSTEEIKIGKYNGKDLYRKIVTITGFSSDQPIVANQLYYGSFKVSDYVTGVDDCFADILHSYINTGTTKRGFIFQQYEPDGDNMTLGTLFQRTNVSALIVLEYTKIAASTRKTSKKK